jgi:hypothetical protein
MRANKEQEEVWVWKENCSHGSICKKKTGRNGLGLAKRRNEQE